MVHSLSAATATPETAAYALKYRNGFFHGEEILSLSDPRFMGLVPYLPIKALRENPGSQEELIAKVAGMSQFNDYGGVARLVRNHFFDVEGSSKHDSQRHFRVNIQDLTVAGRNVGRVMLYGPGAVETAFDQIIYQALQNDNTSLALGGYSGILGLNSALGLSRSMQSKEVYVVLPGELDKQSIGYRLILSDEGENVWVDRLSKLHDFKGRDIVVMGFRNDANLRKIVSALRENKSVASVSGHSVEDRIAA